MRETFLSASSPTATLCCFNKMFLLASFYLISRAHHTDTSIVCYLQALHFPSVRHAFPSFLPANTSFPISLSLYRFLDIIGAHGHIISTDKPCIREANVQRAFSAANELCHPPSSSLRDPAAPFLSPPTASFGWGHRTYQGKGVQPKPTSPTELVRAAKNPNIHNEDTDTCTDFTHKKETVWI